MVTFGGVGKSCADLGLARPPPGALLSPRPALLALHRFAFFFFFRFFYAGSLVLVLC